MAKILAISSQVVFGPVGNTAAVPLLQRAGHDVMQVPTVLLSYHPGHGAPVAQAIDKFEAILTSLQNIGALEKLDAIFTGYFSTAKQVRLTAELVTKLKVKISNLLVLVDPIMGDHGKLYVAEEVAVAIRDELLPLATILTPNVFELSWLTGMRVETAQQVATAIDALHCAEVIATSVPADKKTIATILQMQNLSIMYHSKMRNNVPNGTGDFLAGSYLAHRLKCGAKPAFSKAMAQLEAAIAKSSGAVLDLKR